MLTTRAVVLAKLQTAIGTQAVPAAATDAFLVNDPDYVVDPKFIERKFARNDISPLPGRVGRKLAMCTFSVEARGNEVQQSGLIGDVCRLARLFQACGYTATAIAAAAAAVSNVIKDSANAAADPVATWATGGVIAAGHTRPVLYTITITGATNAAQVTDNAGGAPANITLTTAVAVALGASTCTITPTFAGTFAIGSKFRVLVVPKGVKLAPLTDNTQVLTIEMYFDGLKHVAVDAMGTFKLNAQAGDIAMIDFEFTGNFVAVVDAALPNPVFEETIPPQVELARLTWGSNASLVVDAFSFDQSNTVAPRQDVNSADGYKGVRIPSRNPNGGFSPESTTEATEAFWADFTASRQKSFVATIGTVAGNSLCLFGPRVQTKAIKYSDKDGTRAYDQSLNYTRGTGDDDTFIYLI